MNVGLCAPKKKTKAPKNLDLRQKHAAQAIRHMWMRPGEKMDPALHTFNRYGVQLGTKVPLWGGFTGEGQFALRLWTQRPKQKKEEWAQGWWSAGEGDQGW